MLTSAGDISVGQQQAYMQFELRNTSFRNRLKNNNNVTWFFQTWKHHQVLVRFPFQFNAGKWRVGRLRNGFIPKQTQKVSLIFPTGCCQTFGHLEHPVWFIGLAYLTQKWRSFPWELEVDKMGLLDFDFRSSLDRFYKIERTQYCRGYSYVAFGCFFFTFFLFFIKMGKFS